VRLVRRGMVGLHSLGDQRKLYVYALSVCNGNAMQTRTELTCRAEQQLDLTED
jgi:hypothetical protein